MSLERLHALLASVADARAGGPAPIYELRPGAFFFSRRSRTLPDRQARAFQALRDLDWPLFVAGDLADPRELAPGAIWVRAAARTWLLPREAPTAALLQRWLRAGDYRAYLAREPADPRGLPELFRAAPEDSLARAMGQGIAALLESRPGDREWRILVQPGAVTEVLAA
ncbi:MAG TPA: hypothetical protein VII78_12820 [Myxococcota bacterium]